jgi:hypothetical protein
MRRRRAHPRRHRRPWLPRGSRARALIVDVGVATRVRRHLRPVDRQHRDRRQTAVRTQRQHLAEQAGQRVLMAHDEPRDRRVIGPLLRRQHAERHILDTRPLDHPRGPDPPRVGVEQDRNHDRRVIGRPTAPVPAVGGTHRTPRGPSQPRRRGRPGKMALRQPLPHIWRHHTRRSAVPCPDRLKPAGRHPDYATASVQCSSVGGSAAEDGPRRPTVVSGGELGHSSRR